MNIKKNFIALLATLCVLLPSCSVKDSKYVESSSEIFNEETYDFEDLSVFKVYDNINEKIRFYVLKEESNEIYDTFKEGSLKNKARNSFYSILSEEDFLNAKVTKIKRNYFSLDNSVEYIEIIDIIVENKELDLVAKERKIFILDDNNHLQSVVVYVNVIRNGISNQYSSLSKDENGEYIIDIDAVVLDELDLLEGKYTKDEILEIEEELNNNNLESVRKLI